VPPQQGLGFPPFQDFLVTEWSPASIAKFEVYTVWVRALGVPEILLHKEGFDEIGSMPGTVQNVDMPGYRENNLIRVLVGVRDPTKIPKVSQLTDYPFIYRTRFELEQIVEHGGPIVDGLVKRSEGSASCPRILVKNTNPLTTNIIKTIIMV
jgi:hypothetical protein